MTVDTEKYTLTRSPYEVLKLNRWADNDQVKAHYYHLVKEYNPEHHEEEFIEIRTAFDVLNSPERRAAHDIKNFTPPPAFTYSDYPHFPDETLSKFKLDQEMKTLCGERELDVLNDEEKKQAIHILHGAALYYAHNGQLDHAKDMVDQILRLNPDDEETLRNQAYFDWQKAYEAAVNERYAEAEEIFSHLEEKGVNPAIVNQNLALSQEKQGKKDEANESWQAALNHFKTELKNRPEDKYLQAMMVALHKHTGGKFMEGSTAGIGGSAREMGLACVRQGNWKQALSSLKQALDEDPNDIDVLCQLGWAYLNTGQSPKAFEMWNRAMKKAPSKNQIVNHMVQGYQIYGKRLKEQNIYNQALVQFKNAIKFEPENVELRLELADTYLKMRNYLAAQHEYKKILEYEPRNKDARHGIRESKRLGGLR